MKRIIKIVWHYFLVYFGQGLLYLLPLGLTVFILVLIFQKIDTIFEFDVPGLGLITLVGIVTVVGFLGSFFISSPLFKYFGKLIDRTPIIKMVYNAIKDLMSVFVGNKKKFTEPVLVRLSENIDLEQVGFITQNNLKELGIEGAKVSVYMPYSFSVAGTVYIVPAKNVTKLNIKPQEALKFVVSGGFSISEEK